MQERTANEIADWLSLSGSKAKEAKDTFANFQGLKEPWVSGHGCKDLRSWATAWVSKPGPFEAHKLEIGLF
jgi:hypothetical protein